jgi:light-regulated signal transduction histidine kinase (bacteriophytochrome)
MSEDLKLVRNQRQIQSSDVGSSLPLIRANSAVVCQSAESENRVVQLLAANAELSHQNEYSEKRSAELIVENAALVFQNEEKDKKLVELLLAIKDLEISEQLFKEVNKELESFSYSVSHDLRAPLRAINGYARMLKAAYEGVLDTEANRLMNNIETNAKIMGQLIDDLLSFSRIGRKELRKTNIQMHSMVEDICKDSKNEHSTRDIVFNIRELTPAYADNIAIKQVWLNLISNSIKYSKGTATTIIEIGSEINENEIIYSIKDNGVGFDMRYADKLFEVFQRLHSAEDFEGTGVGLALVQRIILKHGGRVWAKGKVGEGATFYFTLNQL